MGGREISPEMMRAWCALAASESRQAMLQELLQIEVGFADIEEFGLGQQDKLRSGDVRDKKGEENSRKLAKVTLESKVFDEKEIYNGLRRQVNNFRKILEIEHGKNSKPYRAIIKKLRNEAARTRRENKKIYEEKIEHLTAKYRSTEEEKIRKIPEGLEEFDMLSVFDPGKFNEIEVQT